MVVFGSPDHIEGMISLGKDSESRDGYFNANISKMDVILVWSCKFAMVRACSTCVILHSAICGWPESLKPFLAALGKNYLLLCPDSNAARCPPLS